MMQDHEAFSALDELSEIPLLVRLKLLNAVVEDEYFYALSKVVLKSAGMGIDDR